MTTKEAFEKLLDDSNTAIKLKVLQSTVRTWRARLNANKMSLDKMEELLLKSGATKKPEIWKLPKY